MYNPFATYRVQLHKEFNFSQLLTVIEYLHALGIATVYASPIFRSVPGSTHGYDGLDPNVISAEIGDLSSFKEIAERLKEKGMGWLQDIVPNHMAFDSSNEWLMDVLEKGDRSRYRKYFDILPGQIMVPFLGSTLDEAIEKNEVSLSWQHDKLAVKYFDSQYPLNPSGYANVIRLCCDNEAAREIALRIDSLSGENFEEEWKNIRADLIRAKENGIDIQVEKLNADPEILKGILEQQNYRLCHWKETDGQINYRRFFTVNGLICMNMSDPEVFGEYHRFVTSLVSEKLIQGLRVDHADGLYDPQEYLGQLRKVSGEDPYIVIEKILGKDEWLPVHWPIQGNTGYDFLSVVNNLLTNTNGEKPLSRFYGSISSSKKTVQQQSREKKAVILYQHMQGELNNLCALLHELNLVPDEENEKFSADRIKTVIGAFLINMPVYRYYGNAMPLREEEAKSVRELFRVVRQTEPDCRETAFWLEDLLVQQARNNDSDLRLRITHFYKKLMQFSGPLMAKGVEDTLMYTYNRLISRNEVGDSPDSFGISVSDFHHLMVKRRENCPLSLNATATHDTKRGEDARARLNVISDVAEEWIALVNDWMLMNASLKQNGAPDRNDEYFVYQSILGSYPVDAAEEENYPERLKAYLQKALREGKTNSSWSEPNEDYENAVIEFARALLDKSTPFWSSFHQFLQKISDHGFVSSLTQLTIKCTAPGIPDFYQGCELWDFNFVDPDNRRPVDYEKRKQLLAQVDEEDAGVLWNSKADGRIKFWLTKKLLEVRRKYEPVFTAGEYVPVATTGKYKDHILAYGRRQESVMLVTVLSIHTAAFIEGEVTRFDWEDTGLVLPSDVQGDIIDLLAGNSIPESSVVRVSSLFHKLPVSVLSVTTKPGDRKAGLLLHITSLPSQFGIGDAGPAAYRFADFLHRSGQKMWQVLPLNPTGEGQAHSPYSATSSMAGNPLLISPEMLVEKGWLEKEDLASYISDTKEHVLYREVEKAKNQLLSKAWGRFAVDERPEFIAYCEREASWLDDFAFYMLLKEMHKGKAWNEWDEKWRSRDVSALEQLAREQGNKLEFIKWMQFVFDQQWSGLKKYVNDKGIQIVGDLPFYVSYDSADVWVNRDLFALDEKGQMTSVAGVPPDAFSEDGQLWGMPVFKWQKLKETGYQWWVKRILKNRQLFDAVRLDHFRAFSAYWEVDSNEETARNGKWVQGPGEDLFEHIRSALGELPFIAEDLGDIDQPVRELRDQFSLPGMKVLQFAFGDDFGESEFLPHHHRRNFVVYTGTHDNNTMRGWWEEEADEITRERVKEYFGTEISSENVSGYFCRLAYSSLAGNVILPVQDVLGLNGSARMNRPSSLESNWSWRLLPGQITPEVEMKLRKWTRIYNR